MSTDHLLRWVLPVEVACAEGFGEVAEPAGLPEERAAIAHAVAGRRRDYLGVRDCARRALADLGLFDEGTPDRPVIPTGPNREPLWPAGVVGSLTHTDGYRGAAVAPAHAVRSVGIDAEPHAELPAGVFDMVTVPEERPLLRAVGHGVHADRVLFCAKEAIYKAWYPLTGEWLGFEEASVRLEVTELGPVRGRFTARLLRDATAHDGTPLTSFDGYWVVSGGLVGTSVLVPLGPR